MTSEYLESRSLDFEENTFIKSYASIIAKEIYNKHYKNWSNEDVQNCISKMFKISEMIDYIYEEVIEILNDDYSFSSKKNEYIRRGIMLNYKQVNDIKEMYPTGTRIKLKYMSDDFAIRSGMCGTVDFVDDAGQIHVLWDDGRTLPLIVGEDIFEIINVTNNKNIKNSI